MEDFYVVLPSNVRNITGERNTPGHYITYLPKPITLDSDAWKVALVDVSYFSTWHNITPANCQIQGLGPDGPYEVDIRTGYYKTLDKLVHFVNKALQRAGLTATLTLNADTGLCRLNVPSGEVITLDSSVSEMLGLESTYFPSKHPSTDYNAASRGDMGISMLNDIYLYSDVVETRIVGDTYAPLLRTMPALASTDKRGRMTHREFLNPHYLSLSTGQISVIEIKLCDDIGNVIRFDGGYVIVQLHFKKVE